MPDQAPDPARSYERAKPEAESGMGRLDNNKSTPTNAPDRMDQAVKQKQKSHQINTEEEDDNTPRDKRHPRKEGKGGTP